MSPMATAYLTKAQLAAGSLREAIRSGALAPGARVDVDALAAKLSMSATPVREAMRLLQAEGYLESLPHRGMRVTSYSLDDAEELYELRAVLEAYLVRRAAPELTEAQLVELGRLAERQATAVAKGNARGSAQLTRDWHMLIYSAAAAPYVIDFVNRLWDAYPWTTTWSLPGRQEAAVDYHRRITAALRAGDADAASRLMGEHLELGRRLVLDHLAEVGAPPRRRRSA